MKFGNVYKDKFLPKSLTKEETIELLKIKDEDILARQKLIERNIRSVLYVIKKQFFQSTLDNSIDCDDLIHIGILGLIKAIDTFDLNKANTFMTYSYVCIYNEILMYIQKNKKQENNVSLEENIFTKGDANCKVSEVLSDNELLEDKYCNNERYFILWESLKELTDEEKKIILYRYFSEKEMTQEEVSKYFSYSRSNVSRKEKKAFQKIKKKLLEKGIDS